MDTRKQKPVAVNITPASPEIVGENRVEGTIAVVAKQQSLPYNGVIRNIFQFLFSINVFSFYTFYYG